MGKLLDKWNSLSRLQMIICSGIAALVLIGIIVLCLFINTGYFAKSMRLLRVEGYVTLIDEAGTETTIFDNMRFANGQTLTTGIDSLASIAFDDYKIVTLDENSRATFVKERNRMELVLQQGGVFFEVNKPLRDDESFDIRTSTMICGIRGTSGYVYVDNEGNSVLVLTSGHVHVSGVNPTTGHTKEADVNPGQRITVYVVGDTVEFNLESISEYDLSYELICYLCNNSNSMSTTCQATGWSADLIRNLYNGTAEIEATETLETEESTAQTSASERSATPTPRATSTHTPTPVSTTTQTEAGTPIPTNPPTPTPTATPTPTPRATNTPTPTSTPTPAPVSQSSNSSSDETTTQTTTNTPAPNNTPTPRPITPVPTEVPAPTEAPTPTESLVPTETPAPTVAPEPTVIPEPEPEPDPTERPDPQPGDVTEERIPIGTDPDTGGFIYN